MDTLKQQRRRASMPLMWLGIGSIIMAFAGLTSGYVVSRTSLVQAGQWLTFELPVAFRYSTLIIVLSSLTFYWAKKSIANDQVQMGWKLLALTALLGTLFIVFQVSGWEELINENIYFAGAGSNPAGSWVYAISLFHIAHVAGGIIALLVVTIKAITGYYSSENSHGVKLMGMYWHFVDLLWLYLYAFLSVIR